MSQSNMTHKCNENVPPGQFVTKKFPVLSCSPTPQLDMRKWQFRIFGDVENEVSLTWDQFASLPNTKITADFHCVTHWSRLDNIWEGVLFRDLIRLTRPQPKTKFIMVHSYGGYTTNMLLKTLLDGDVLFAYHHDGNAIEPDHGGPLRLVVPKRYGWKSAKWVNGLEFMSHNRPGFWEIQGYNNNADPWKEERFWPATTDPGQV